MSSFYMISVSGFIAAALAIQFAVGMTYHGGARWPFMSYPMYANDRAQGERIDDYTVSAVFDDGRVEVIDPDAVGLSFWIMRANYVRPILRGEFGMADSEAMAIFCDVYGQGIVKLEVYDIGVTVETNGPVYGEPQFVAASDAACPAREG